MITADRGEPTGYADCLVPGAASSIVCCPPLHDDDSDPATPKMNESLSHLGAPPVFVVGAHRSGTTWVYEMLTRHPHVAGVFESGLFSVNLGVAPLFHPTHWYRDPDRLEADREFFGHSFRLNQLLDRDEVRQDVAALSSRWLARALGPEDRYLVEKTPQHVHTMPIIAELFPGAAFIHVIRDGRDIAVSQRAVASSWPGVGPPIGVTDMALRWAEVIRTGRSHGESGGARYLEVRYEELRRDPGLGLGSMFEFCGIPFDDDLVHEICESTRFEPSSGAVDEGGFRRRAQVGEWRRRLSLPDRIRFDRAAGVLLVELGYAGNRQWWLPWGRS